MSAKRLTPELRMQRVISLRDKQVQDLKNSRDYWVKRALTAEKAKSTANNPRCSVCGDNYDQCPNNYSGGNVGPTCPQSY